MKCTLFGVMLLLTLTSCVAVHHRGAHAVNIGFSTVSVKDDTGIYSIVFSGDELIGLPALALGELISLIGVGDRYDGKYYVDEVTHSFGGEGGGGYRSSLRLERDGSPIVDEDGETDVSLFLQDYRLSFSSIMHAGVTITEFKIASVP